MEGRGVEGLWTQFHEQSNEMSGGFLTLSLAPPLRHQIKLAVRLNTPLTLLFCLPVEHYHETLSAVPLSKVAPVFVGESAALQIRIAMTTFACHMRTTLDTRGAHTRAWLSS